MIFCISTNAVTSLAAKLRSLENWSSPFSVSIGNAEKCSPWLMTVLVETTSIAPVTPETENAAVFYPTAQPTFGGDNETQRFSFTFRTLQSQHNTALTQIKARPAGGMRSQGSPAPSQQLWWCRHAYIKPSAPSSCKQAGSFSGISTTRSYRPDTPCSR